MRVKVGELKAMILESVQNAYEQYDGMGEPVDLKVARLDGRKQARKKFAGKEQDVEFLKKAYLHIERQTENELDPVKNTFLWGALEQIGAWIKKAGQQLPKKPGMSAPWG